MSKGAIPKGEGVPIPPLLPSRPPPAKCAWCGTMLLPVDGNDPPLRCYSCGKPTIYADNEVECCWRCPACGAEYEDGQPRTCHACGRPSRGFQPDSAPGVAEGQESALLASRDEPIALEHREMLAQAAVTRLLQTVGEDPTREGLLDTPKRVVKALREMTEGYAQDPNAILGTIFTEPCDEMIVVTGIDFVSLCEHHMLSFAGTASVAYVPGAIDTREFDSEPVHRVVGLSKIARLVECFARRLQVQERLTRQIADTLMFHEKLRPRGVGVIIRSKHSCMGCRGIRKPGAFMVTSSLHGVLEKPEARAEFLSFAGA